jgi:segregation and condensation protein B
VSREEVWKVEAPVTDRVESKDTRALEAILFVSDEPVSSGVVAQTLGLERAAVDAMCERLARDLEARGSGLVLRSVGGGWRLFRPG